MTGKELQSWREGHGLQVRDLAETLGVNRLTINRWESGESSIPNYMPMALKGLAFSHNNDWMCCCQSCTRRRVEQNDPRLSRDPFTETRAATRVTNAREAKRRRLAIAKSA